MGRYSSIEWAGKVVSETIPFILAVTEQCWNHGSLADWKVPAKCIEELGIKALVKAYDAVAEHHKLPKYSGKTFVATVIGSANGGGDQKFVRDEARFIVATFSNAMQYMANNPGWQEAQDLQEKVALERLENLIRIVRGFRSSYDEKRYDEKHGDVVAA